MNNFMSGFMDQCTHSGAKRSMTRALARLRLLLALTCATVVLSACGLFSGKEIDRTAGWSPSKLYSEAQVEMSDRNWQGAIKLFESLQSRYPFGRFAQQALMEQAFCHYKDNEPALARATAERFIKQYPNHPNVDYLFYLKGLASFNDNLGLLAGLSRQDLTERDPKALRESFDAFKDLAQRFPNSAYTVDAELRMRYLVNAMALNQIHVATYYMRRGAYMAAANRAQLVVREFQQAPAVEEALYIMYMAYDALQLTELREDTKKVLDKNFPNSELWTRGLRKRDVAWWQLW